MSQKFKDRIVIDINKHGIRRETNLDSLYKKSQKKKSWENKKKISGKSR